MAEIGHAVAWTGIRPDRREEALEVWARTLDLFDRSKADGRLESYDLIIFQSTGGVPAGVVIGWGSADQIEAFDRDQERLDIATKAASAVEGLVTTRCTRVVIDRPGSLTDLASGSFGSVVEPRS